MTAARTAGADAWAAADAWSAADAWASAGAVLGVVGRVAAAAVCILDDAGPWRRNAGAAWYAAVAADTVVRTAVLPSASSVAGSDCFRHS